MDEGDDEDPHNTPILVASSLTPYHGIGEYLVEHGADDFAYERQQDDEDEAAEEFHALSDDEGESTDEEGADDEDTIERNSCCSTS